MSRIDDASNEWREAYPDTRTLSTGGVYLGAAGRGDEG